MWDASAPKIIKHPTEEDHKSDRSINAWAQERCPNPGEKDFAYIY